MTTENNEIRPAKRRGGLFTQPINRLLIASFICVALIPVVVLGIKLYEAAWEDAWREIHEKHRLLALNLAAPLSLYVEDHRSALSLLAMALEQQMAHGDPGLEDTGLLAKAGQQLAGFKALYLANAAGEVRYSTANGQWVKAKPDAFRNDPGFLGALKGGDWALSGIQPSPISGEPTVLMAQAVHAGDGQAAFVLLGELKIDLIEQLRRRIRFGKKGHSAIVDQTGRVVAHPNPEWMRTMRDLSNLPIVEKMMAGGSGVTEFYSPFIKENMVAGYASVPGIGWGVMVPQPKSEVEANVNALLYAEFGWGLFGLGFAVTLGVILARWITRPINRLAQAVIALADSGYRGQLQVAEDGYAPKEIQLLNNAFSGLVEGLQHSHDKIDQLNRNLQLRVDEATVELRQANTRLGEMARSDFLTALANRRHFEDVLAKSLANRRSRDEFLCLMFIDIDHFKIINDQYGHAAGDAVLKELAGLLQQRTRECDLVARYAGDEFIIKMDCEREVGRYRANDILRAIQNHEFEWSGQGIQVTVSVGLLYHRACGDDDVDALMHRLDQALYEAKETGRNRVVEFEV